MTQRTPLGKSDKKYVQYVLDFPCSVSKFVYLLHKI